MIRINPDVFCNSPWFELHIYQNGDYGFCCQQESHPYTVETPNLYNVKTMSIEEWYHSEPMNQARLRMFSDQRWDICRDCWKEEEVTDSGRRHRQNQKSILFKSNMQQSFEQSPNYPLFKYSADSGKTTQLPVDLHIDLGNQCNLACKMCWPGASSTIASKMKQWKIADVDQYLKFDWTRDEEVWTRFLSQIKDLNLKQIHIMGGEPTTHPKFKELINFLVANTDTSKFGFSFVTNGTNYDSEIVTLLETFRNANIEISIETANEINDYIRQGSEVSEILDNIEKYKKHISNRLTVTLRPCISSLSIRDYWTLIKYSLDNQLIIKSRHIVRPENQQPIVIPREIRQTWKQPYLDLREEYGLNDLTITDTVNESNPVFIKVICNNQIKQALNFLEADDHPQQKELLEDMIIQMKPWDKDYKLNAREFYPELTEYFDRVEY